MKKQRAELQLILSRNRIVPLCLVDKVSDRTASNIQLKIVAFIKTTEFDPLETAIICGL
jgi:hypothetical protein